MKKTVAILLVLGAASVHATLPPPGAEAKAQVEETAAKAAWSAKVDLYKLCQAQDRVAAVYYAQAKDEGKPTRPPVPTAGCEDPGPFSYVPPEDRPRETSGAHSPAGTASQPPSTRDPAAESNPKP